MSNNLNFKPYVRFAMYHTWFSDYVAERSIYDFEIIYIDNGELSLFIDNKEYICKEGDVIYIPPNVYHKITWHRVNCCQPHVHFDFERDELSKIIPISFKEKEEMNEVELTYFRENYLEKHGITLPYVLTPKNPSKIRSLVLEIINKFNHNDPSKELALEGLLKTLIAAVISESSGYVDEEQHSDVLTLVIKYMAENVQSNLKLEDFEKYSNLSSWSLNELFRKTYKKTPKKYYDELRISYVKSLVRHSFKSVKEISAMVGFDEPQTFSRWFKNYVGVYPTEYKNFYRNRRNSTKNEKK